ncbi:MAG TPA: tetratricopeptide repeat protein, partial [Candidatus Altiarchaeales archaeon]|nr:tetratricopeptide repeat protein [Candidatus Altiarchaeales archaeon]
MDILYITTLEKIRNMKKNRNSLNAAIGYYRIARAFHQVGDFDRAVLNYMRAIRLYPEFIECYIKLGDILYQKGDISGAIRNYRKAIELDPNNAKYYLALSNALRGIGDLRGAIEAYNKAKDIDPTINSDRALRRELARIEDKFELSDLDDSVKSLYELDGAVDEKRMPGQPMYAKEVLDKLKSLSPLIVKSIEKFVEIDLVDDIVQDVSHIHICFSYEWGDDYEKGWLQMLENKKGTFVFHLYEFDPDNPNYGNRNVKVEFDNDNISEPEILHITDLEGNPVESITLEQLSLAEPEGFTAYVTYDDRFHVGDEKFDIKWAESYFVESEHVKRIKILKNELKNNKSEIYKEIADLYFKIKEFGSAVKFYEKVIELDPENAEHYYDAGNCLFLDGDWRGASIFYGEAIDLLEKRLREAEGKNKTEINEQLGDLYRKRADTWMMEGSRPVMERSEEYDKAINRYNEVLKAGYNENARRNKNLCEIARDYGISTHSLEEIARVVGHDFLRGDNATFRIIIKISQGRGTMSKVGRKQFIQNIIDYYLAAKLISDAHGVEIKDVLRKRKYYEEFVALVDVQKFRGHEKGLNIVDKKTTRGWYIFMKAVGVLESKGISYTDSIRDSIRKKIETVWKGERSPATLDEILNEVMSEYKSRVKSDLSSIGETELSEKIDKLKPKSKRIRRWLREIFRGVIEGKEDLFLKLQPEKDISPIVEENLRRLERLVNDLVYELGIDYTDKIQEFIRNEVKAVEEGKSSKTLNDILYEVILRFKIQMEAEIGIYLEKDYFPRVFNDIPEDMRGIAVEEAMDMVRDGEFDKSKLSQKFRDKVRKPGKTQKEVNEIIKYIQELSDLEDVVKHTRELERSGELRPKTGLEGVSKLIEKRTELLDMEKEGRRIDSELKKIEGDAEITEEERVMRLNELKNKKKELDRKTKKIKREIDVLEYRIAAMFVISPAPGDYGDNVGWIDTLRSIKQLPEIQDEIRRINKENAKFLVEECRKNDIKITEDEIIRYYSPDGDAYNAKLPRNIERAIEELKYARRRLRTKELLKKGKTEKARIEIGKLIRDISKEIGLKESDIIKLYSPEGEPDVDLLKIKLPDIISVGDIRTRSQLVREIVKGAEKHHKLKLSESEVIKIADILELNISNEKNKGALFVTVGMLASLEKIPEEINNLKKEKANIEEEIRLLKDKFSRGKIKTREFNEKLNKLTKKLGDIKREIDRKQRIERESKGKSNLELIKEFRKSAEEISKAYSTDKYRLDINVALLYHGDEVIDLSFGNIESIKKTPDELENYWKGRFGEGLITLEPKEDTKGNKYYRLSASENASKETRELVNWANKLIERMEREKSKIDNTEIYLRENQVKAVKIFVENFGRDTIYELTTGAGKTSVLIPLDQILHFHHPDPKVRARMGVVLYPSIADATAATDSAGIKELLEAFDIKVLLFDDVALNNPGEFLREIERIEREGKRVVVLTSAANVGFLDANVTLHTRTNPERGRDYYKLYNRFIDNVFYSIDEPQNTLQGACQVGGEERVIGDVMTYTKSIIAVEIVEKFIKEGDLINRIINNKAGYVITKIEGRGKLKYETRLPDRKLLNELLDYLGIENREEILDKLLAEKGEGKLSDYDLIRELSRVEIETDTGKTTLDEVISYLKSKVKYTGEGFVDGTNYKFDKKGRMTLIMEGDYKYPENPLSPGNIYDHLAMVMESARIKNEQINLKEVKISGGSIETSIMRTLARNSLSGKGAGMNAYSATINQIMTSLDSGIRMYSEMMTMGVREMYFKGGERALEYLKINPKYAFALDEKGRDAIKKILENSQHDGHRILCAEALGIDDRIIRELASEEAKESGSYLIMNERGSDNTWIVLDSTGKEIAKLSDAELKTYLLKTDKKCIVLLGKGHVTGYDMKVSFHPLVEISGETKLDTKFVSIFDPKTTMTRFGQTLGRLRYIEILMSKPELREIYFVDSADIKNAKGEIDIQKLHGRLMRNEGVSKRKIHFEHLSYAVRNSGVILIDERIRAIAEEMYRVMDKRRPIDSYKREIEILMSFREDVKKESFKDVNVRPELRDTVKYLESEAKRVQNILREFVNTDPRFSELSEETREIIKRAVEKNVSLKRLGVRKSVRDRFYRTNYRNLVKKFGDISEIHMNTIIGAIENNRVKELLKDEQFMRNLPENLKILLEAYSENRQFKQILENEDYMRNVPEDVRKRLEFLVEKEEKYQFVVRDITEGGKGVYMAIGGPADVIETIKKNVAFDDIPKEIPGGANDTIILKTLNKNAKSLEKFLGKKSVEEIAGKENLERIKESSQEFMKSVREAIENPSVENLERFYNAESEYSFRLHSVRGILHTQHNIVKENTNHANNVQSTFNDDYEKIKSGEVRYKDVLPIARNLSVLYSIGKAADYKFYKDLDKCLGNIQLAYDSKDKKKLVKAMIQYRDIINKRGSEKIENEVNGLVNSLDKQGSSIESEINELEKIVDAHEENIDEVRSWMLNTTMSAEIMRMMGGRTEETVSKEEPEEFKARIQEIEQLREEKRELIKKLREKQERLE